MKSTNTRPANYNATSADIDRAELNEANTRRLASEGAMVAGWLCGRDEMGKAFAIAGTSGQILYIVRLVDDKWTVSIRARHEITTIGTVTVGTFPKYVDAVKLLILSTYSAGKAGLDVKTYRRI